MCFFRVGRNLACFFLRRDRKRWRRPDPDQSGILYIYGLAGIFTVFIVTIPVMVYLLFTRQQVEGDLLAFAVLSLTIILLVSLSISFIKKG